VSWDAFESERVSPESLTKCEIAFAQRLPFSLVAEGHDWVKRRTAEFDSSAIRTMLATKALYQLDLLSEDALGMVEAGDTESAVLAARQAFGYAVEALLCSHGEYTEQDKWRARRLRSVAPAELEYEEYWELETMRGFDSAEPGAWVERVLRVCQRIANEVQL
jgi:HEPN domain-containing protein